MSTVPLLAVESLGFRHGRRPILADLDLKLAPGQRLTVAGRSGSGKTTLLRLIAGLEKPAAGTIHLDGRPASRPGAVLLPPWRRGVQMVFQDLGLWPARSVAANVSDALRAQGQSRGAARARALEILRQLGVDHCARRKPGTLSGGEARRLAFARALALQPRLLLLDEPFASLDPAAKAQGLALLHEALLEQSGAAVILVTHDPAEALALGGEACLLRAGRLDDPRPSAELCGDAEIFRRALEA